MMEAKFEIPRIRINYFLEKLEAVNKRAAKLGLEPVRYEVVGGETVEVKSVYVGVEHRNGKTHRLTHEVYREYQWIKITGDQPKLGGWRMLAVYDYTLGDEPVVRLVPGVEDSELPDGARERGAICDHCGTRRRRKMVYLLQHEDGATKLIGKNCLVDFLGSYGTDPELIGRRAEILWQALESFSGFDDEDSWSQRPEGIELINFLPHVAAHIRVDGWVSATKARQSETMSTSDSALGWMFAGPKERAWRIENDPKWVEAVKPTPEDVKLAQGAIVWAIEEGTKNGASEYLVNLKVIAEAGWATWKMTSYAASMVASYQRSMDRLVRKQTLRERIGAAGKSSGWVGEPKKRSTWVAFVTRRSGFEGDYGHVDILGMVTPDGDELTWFCTGELCYGNSEARVNVGDKLEVTGTVKAHTTYKGIKQTQLNRCRLALVEPFEVHQGLADRA